MGLITRRAALAATAAAPAALALPKTTRADGHSGAPETGLPKARSFMLGEFEVVALNAGSGTRPDPQQLFGTNVSAEEFAAVSEENFIPSDSFTGFFIPTLVKTGSEAILFDTGLNAGGLVGALAAAGHGPEDITHVVLTHMHPDHIGGLTGDDGAPTFPNAAYVTGQTEFDFWSATDNEMIAAKVTPFADQMTFIGDGDAVASGVTGMAAFGHSPGHMVFMLDSGGQQLVLTADLANHYVWSLAYPDWHFGFDADKDAAVASRRRVLSMLAAEKMPFIGYHMPFPGAGFVETREDGFRYVPVSYQMMG